MNLNKNKLPPSPRSQHARKPLYNLENLQTCSLERIKKKNTEQIQKYHVYDSLTNVKHHFIRNCTNKTEKTQSTQKSIHMHRKIEIENKCKNHKERAAVNFIERIRQQYYCFQCSLQQARRGVRLIPISSKRNQQTQKAKQTRKNEIRFFIQKAQHAEININQCLQQKEDLLIKIESQCNELTQKQKNKFEKIIKDAQMQYLTNLQLINSFKCDQIKIINQLHNVLQQKRMLILSNRRDVLKNYEDCVQSFAVQQFRSIMQKYWESIKKSYEVVAQQKYRNQEVRQNIPKLIQLIHEFENSKRQSQEFTFSKQSIFETPKSGAKINGVKVVSSLFLKDNSNAHQKVDTNKSWKQNPQNLST